MFYDFRDFLQTLGFVLFIVVVAPILLIIFFYCTIVYGDYLLDKSQCEVLVNNKVVAQTGCHFVYIDSIGENGNTKRVTIHKDILNLKPLNHYVSNNIVVNTKGEE